MKDLFGHDLTETEAYDLLKRKTTLPRGHAWPCGTGPAGETCGSCRHRVKVFGGTRYHQKCGRNKTMWTHGPGSDIRAKDAACKLWEGKNDSPCRPE